MRVNPKIRDHKVFDNGLDPFQVLNESVKSILSKKKILLDRDFYLITGISGFIYYKREDVFYSSYYDPKSKGVVTHKISRDLMEAVVKGREIHINPGPYYIITQDLIEDQYPNQWVRTYDFIRRLRQKINVEK